MLRENSFAVAVGLSILGHVSLFVFSPSRLNPVKFFPQEKEEVEVTYFQIASLPQVKEVPQWPTLSKEPPSSSPQAASSIPQTPPLEGSEAVNVAPSKGASSGREGEEKGEELEEEILYKEMTERLQDPVFLTYYQGIREKIRKAAKRRYQNRATKGDISLGFTLFSSGRVKEVRVFKKSSQPVPLLQSVAVQSILDASPFPPFPDPLRHEQISFVVVLTFEPKP